MSEIKLNIIGNSIGSSGYNNHIRQLANALFNEGIRVRLDTQIPQQFIKDLTDNELTMIKEKVDKDFIDLIINLPPTYPLLRSDRKMIGYCVWEAQSIPNYWIKYLKLCNQIWVPSEHTKKAINNTASHLNDDELVDILFKVKVIPHGVDINLFKKENSERSDKFTFICNKGWNKGWNDRGGIQFAIKAFNEEFDINENVEILIKLNPIYFPQNFNLQKEIEKLNLRKEGRAFKISIDNIPFNKLSLLYNQGDCFVCPTMGEGWGLTIGEAMSCGLCPIVTGWGGQTDFINKDNGFLIDYDLIDIKGDILYEGLRWATPNIKHLRELMRYAFENQDLIKKKGLKAREDIINNWTWKDTAKKAIKALEEI
jgi:glycosyltransferase involved in cell wall biosynthesis